MTPTIDIRADHLRIVQDVLHQHLPAGVKVWVLGSRATRVTKDSSDLSLALEGNGEIPPRSLSALEVAFKDSKLPFAVDVVDAKRIGEGFREILTGQRVALPERVDSGTAEGGSGDPLAGVLPRGWERSTLGTACARGGGNIQTGPFGSQLHASDYRPVGVPSIMPQNLGENRVVADGIARIGEHDARRLRRYLVRTGDIVYSRRGDVERRALIGLREDGWLCGTGCLRVRLGENGADPRYASYYLGHPAVREWIVRHAHGATMPNLNTAILSACPFVAPPIPEQRAIAHILGTLDDKIDRNRRMNATLEAMARALFRSWFVDFDPVRAKMEGRDTGLPRDIADLFPGGFIDSATGDIPIGWTVATLGDIALSPRMGVDPAGVDDDTPYIGLEHMPRRSVALINMGRAQNVASQKAAFERGDTLFGKLRPYFHKVGIAPVNGICSTDIVVLKARMPRWSAFVLACVSSSEFVDHASRTSTGTKMPRTSWHTMGRYELCLPTDAVATVFQNVVSPMLERIVANVNESRTLAVLRDALLPKLVSGEMRACDREELSEGAA